MTTRTSRRAVLAGAITMPIAAAASAGAERSRRAARRRRRIDARLVRIPGAHLAWSDHQGTGR